MTGRRQPASPGRIDLRRMWVETFTASTVGRWVGDLVAHRVTVGMEWPVIGFERSGTGRAILVGTVSVLWRRQRSS